MTKLLLVHGAFHGAWCWDRLLPELSARGVSTHTIDLPFTSLADDEAATVAAVEKLSADGEPVVILGHSFGGAVISGAGGLGKAGRPGVAHLIYLAALLVDPDDPVALDPSPGMTALRFEGDLASVDPLGATLAFYHRCAPPDAEWATAQLRAMPSAVLSAPSSTWAWKAVPSTYIVCTDDQIVAPDAQRRMAARASDVFEIDSDHSPFLACPAMLADLVAPIIRSI
jgi:pimeloyl-ACP methyl ester carboxylesterase